MSTPVNLFVIGILTFTPQQGGQYGPAINSSRRAILNTTELHKTSDQVSKFQEKTLVKIEKIVYENTGLNRTHLIYVSWVMPLRDGKVTTKPFTNLKLRGPGWTIRPDIEYVFDSHDVNSVIRFTYSF